VSQTTRQKRECFRTLHDSGCFILRNLWAVGSGRMLASPGFAALATTSAGLSIEGRDVEGGRKSQVASVNRVGSDVYTVARD
jgi:2-methylisocitrate lyase-like PEP mutase family enzyme